MTPQDRGTPRYRSPTTGNNSHRQATEGGEPRTIRQAPRATANTGSKGKELQQRGRKFKELGQPNSRNRQAKTTRTREGELPLKEGRNQDKTAAFLPSPNKRQRKKRRREQQKERGDKRPRRQNAAPEAPQAPQTGAVGGAKRLGPNNLAR